MIIFQKYSSVGFNQSGQYLCTLLTIFCLGEFDLKWAGFYHTIAWWRNLYIYFVCKIDFLNDESIYEKNSLFFPSLHARATSLQPDLKEWACDSSWLHLAEAYLLLVVLLKIQRITQTLCVSHLQCPLFLSPSFREKIKNTSWTIVSFLFNSIEENKSIKSWTQSDKHFLS